MSSLSAVEGLSLDDLRHLEALVRLGSAAAAGRELGIAASTVYRRVGSLEAALGVRCLIRGEGVTPVARRLAELARRTGDNLIAISRLAQEEPEAVSGTVTITTIDGFAPLLAGPIAALARASPTLTINLHISDKGLSLRRRHADIALSVLRQPSPHLIGRRLFPIDFGVFAAPGVPTAPGEARWVILGWPLQSTLEARWERAHVPSEAVAIATPSRRAFVDLVVAGVGIGLLPRKLAALHPQLVEVEAHSVTSSALQRTAWLLTHPELRGHARIAIVMRTLGNYLR